MEKNNKKMNNKGSILDLIFVCFVLVFFGIVTLIGLNIGGQVKDEIVGMAGMPTESKTAATSIIDNYTHTIDNSFLFFTIFLGIATLVLAALVRIHPIFIPFYFVGWIIVIFLSGILSNIYQGMAADPALASTASDLIFMGTILTYLPIVVGVFGMFLMFVMYKLWSVGNEY